MAKQSKPRKKGSVGRLIARLLLMVFISVLIGGGVYMLNAKMVLHKEMPMPFGWGMSVVLSGSMEPTLSVDDLVIVRATEDYAEGDVAVYSTGRSLVIHRIVSMDEDAVVTRGDANNVDDAAISREQLLGRMEYAIPGAGKIVRVLRTAPAQLCLLALSIWLLSNSWRKEREEDEKELDAIKAEIRRLQALETDGKGEGTHESKEI